MESSSITFSYMQVKAYASTAGPRKALACPGCDDSAPEPHHCDARSGDGDTFTLSVEARMLQVSITETGDGAAADGGDDPNATPLVKALMQAVKDIFGQDGVGSDGIDAGKGLGRRHHGHGPLHGPQDVADHVLKHAEKEYARIGGTLGDFIDEMKKRMEARPRGHGPDDGDFRNQVNALVTAGLDAWAQGGDAKIS